MKAPFSPSPRVSEPLSLRAPLVTLEDEFLESFWYNMEHHGLQFHTPQHIPPKATFFFSHLRPPRVSPSRFLSLLCEPWVGSMSGGRGAAAGPGLRAECGRAPGGPPPAEPAAGFPLLCICLP